MLKDKINTIVKGKLWEISLLLFISIYQNLCMMETCYKRKISTILTDSVIDRFYCTSLRILYTFINPWFMLTIRSKNCEKRNTLYILVCFPNDVNMFSIYRLLFTSTMADEFLLLMRTILKRAVILTTLNSRRKSKIAYHRNKMNEITRG